jgi:ATP/maltotriose-dependent transcriptional regulator MalT
LLPAYVEIMLAAGNLDEARVASVELDEIARSFNMDLVGAMAAHARGALQLAEGDAQAAIEPLRHAFTVWQQVGAPYIAARVRVLVGLACRALGDEDGTALELAAARAVFEQLGAAPDLAHIDSFLERALPSDRHGLSPRELEVLRLVAAGKTNRLVFRRSNVSVRGVVGDDSWRRQRCSTDRQSHCRSRSCETKAAAIAAAPPYYAGTAVRRWS